MTELAEPASSPTRPAFAARAQACIEQVVAGQGDALQCLLVALVSGGHVLLEGVPGVAKTLLVRSLAAVFAGSFARVQFTPDLMPADVTGVNVFDARTGEFRFRRGPVFADLLLADEINRAPAKTQSALLEAMQELQVTVDGESHPLPPLFTVVATQNPIEYEGTYPLPEAQLDRFMFKVIVGYPSEPDERRMISLAQRAGERGETLRVTTPPIGTPEDILSARRQAMAVRVDESVADYILALIRQSRSLATLSLGASPRAAVMLMQAAKSLACLRGLDYVTPDEVQTAAKPALRHRIRLTPEAQIEGLTPDACVDTLLAQVPIPR